MSQQAERALILLAARSEADQDGRPVGGAALAVRSSHERRALVERVLNAFADSPASEAAQLGLLGVFGG